MDLELAMWLSTYAAVMAGDLTSVSIGGTPKKPRQGLVGGALGSLGTGLGLFGQPQGLSHSHNRFEADVSPTRGDLYVTYVDLNHFPFFPPLVTLFFFSSFSPLLTTSPRETAATSTRSTSRTSSSSGTCRRAPRATI